ncbi:MAG: type VI secretion protein IcmF/TssM N-terminal domain-containing protein [Desulfuromonadaceae bacterium]|nr:type VI secretion protein IcmF/TssM N-terminal domain-containing protein [Desulfuromonadaceae bacterium]
MKNTLLTILKYLLIVALVALVLLAIIGIIYIMSWPWWVGIFLAICLVGLYIGFLFIRKLLQRRREQNFVQQVIEQDNSQVKAMSSAEQGQMLEIQERWKDAIETLKSSHLKKQGNPLYVLPWYMIMGESGSGKTTAISSARLTSPFSEAHHTSGVSGTRNCDWWFFDKSIIIDTAGRYAINVDQGGDRDEWQKFLSLLGKYRKKEPINGLIITVAADKLMGGYPETLEADGKQLRSRIDELMLSLGVKFPVYLLVTKCDLIQGMTQFCEALPEQSQTNPMGFINQELSKDVSGFFDTAFKTVTERLKNLRLYLLNQSDSGRKNSGVVLFPDEFQCLKPGLEVFVKTAFQENNYQDTPLFRGVFFSSGKQEGTPFSKLLGGLGLISEQEILPGTSRGIFLHDFFDKVLPMDRSMFAPTSRSREWQMITRNLGLASWILIWVSLCGILSYSFVKNMSIIRDATGVIAKSPQLKGNFFADLDSMDQFRQMVLRVEQKNRNWWIPRLWLYKSRDVEVELKKRYAKQFQERFLAEFDRGMSGVIGGVSMATPEDAAGQYVVHLVRRINLLQASLDASGVDSLKGKPLPDYVAVSIKDTLNPEVTKKFGNLYLYYLAWRLDKPEVNKEIAQLQLWLKHLLSVKGGDLRWTVEWANRSGVAQPVTLASFWPGSRKVNEDILVPPAFTKKGKNEVVTLMEEIKGAYPELGIVERESARFEVWYRSNAYASWQRFAGLFPRGEERLAGAKEWQAAAAAMTTDQGAYQAFLTTMASELLAFGTGEATPAWVQQVFQYQIIKTPGVAVKTIDEGKKLAEKVGDLVGKKVESGAQLAAVKPLQEYLAAVAAMSPATKSRPQAFQLTQQVFSEDAVSSKSPFYLAADASRRLRASYPGGIDDTMFKLVTGPSTFLWSFVRKESACVLQKQWEEKVLQDAQAATDSLTLQAIMGPEGPVWKYAKDPAGPFIGWTPQQGYYTKSALGGSVDFNPSFFVFLKKGAKAKIAAGPAIKLGSNVNIKGLPTDVNNEATTKPQGTRLEMQCASGVFVIENLNFPVSKNLVWSPDTCGEVVFQIEIGDLVLSHKYENFPEFLKAFEGGRHTFYAQDFPREKSLLDRMKVRFIRVNYQFSGTHEIVKMARGGGNGGSGASQGLIPRAVAHCWD